MTTSTFNTSKFKHSSAFRSLALAWIVSLAGTAAVAVIVCLLDFTPARAGTAAVHSVTVSLRDLDLSKPEGAKTAYRRIQGAARWVCGTEAFLDLSQRHAWENCYNNAVSDAVAKVNNPLLTALYEHRRPPSRIAMVR